MLLSDLVAIALFLFLVWDRVREGLGPRKRYSKPQKESQCRAARTQDTCVKKAGGIGTTCYWCTEENNGAGGCVEASPRAEGGDCSSNYP